MSRDHSAHGLDRWLCLSRHACEPCRPSCAQTSVILSAAVFFFECGVYDPAGAHGPGFYRPSALGDTVELSPFSSLPASMWYVVSTITTVGYGDITPTTVGGKFVGTLTILISLFTLSLPFAVLANNFATLYHSRRRSELAVAASVPRRVKGAVSGVYAGAPHVTVNAVAPAGPPPVNAAPTLLPGMPVRHTATCTGVDATSLLGPDAGASSALAAYAAAVSVAEADLRRAVEAHSAALAEARARVLPLLHAAGCLDSDEAASGGESADGGAASALLQVRSVPQRPQRGP